VTDKKEMPANGGGAAKGKPDGVSGSPDTGETGQIHGRSGGGESGGGAYPNPYSGKGSADTGSSDLGAQNAYFGGDNPNATTKPQNSLEKEEPAAEESDPSLGEAHRVEAGGRTFEVIEESGVAAAIAAGKTGTEAEPEKDSNLAG
jgi:hypothetical protein